MRIGIGITTRNRPDVLRLALMHHAAFRPADSRIVVVDDCSDKPLPDVGDARLVVNKERLGIAGSKNVCLRELSDCDWVFLFDDDAFPSNPGWADMFIGPCERNGYDHLMFLEEVPSIHVRKIKDGPDGIVGYDNCLGCMLLLSRKAIDTLGGYDKRFGLYGYEHAQLSIRAFNAGLSPFKYSSISRASMFIYSVDVHFKAGKPVPLGVSVPGLGNSSVTAEDRKDTGKYAALLSDTKIKMEI